MRVWLTLIVALTFTGSVEHADARPRPPLEQHVAKLVQAEQARAQSERQTLADLIRALVRAERMRP